MDSIKFIEIKVGEDLRCGSGFVIDSSILVTAGHNVAAGPIRTYEGEEKLYPSKIYFLNDPGAVDVALLFFEGSPFKRCAPFHYQYRLPEIGEEVAALGFPQLAYREPTVVMHTGTIEALPKSFARSRFIQTSFQGGGGLSGGPLVDQKGLLLGLMVENVFMEVKVDEGEGKKLGPLRPYGQAVPFEYVARIRAQLRSGDERCVTDSKVTIISKPRGRDAF